MPPCRPTPVVVVVRGWSGWDCHHHLPHNPVKSESVDRPVPQRRQVTAAKIVLHPFPRRHLAPATARPLESPLRLHHLFLPVSPTRLDKPLRQPIRPCHKMPKAMSTASTRLRSWPSPRRDDNSQRTSMRMRMPIRSCNIFFSKTKKRRNRIEKLGHVCSNI